MYDYFDNQSKAFDFIYVINKLQNRKYFVQIFIHSLQKQSAVNEDNLKPFNPEGDFIDFTV